MLRRFGVMMRNPKSLTRRSFLLGMGTAPGWGWSSLASGGQKYLALDSRIIDRKEGVRLSLGAVRKDPHNPLFIEDRPWEARFDNLYANVLFDEQEKTFKCWYNPFIPAFTGMPARRDMGVCYAVSQDGLAWTKPELGIIEIGASTKNNLVGRGAHGTGVFRDSRDPDPARRYKMFFKAHPPGLVYPVPYRGLSVPFAARFSPDGVHWSEDVELPGIDASGDTHNNAFWAPELNKYVGITRMRAPGWGRIVGRTESADFLHWTKAVEALRSLPEESVHRQVYAMPVFRYANVYLGLAMMFDTDTGVVDCELTWSPDTVRWERVCPRTPLIPRGPQGSYDSGCIFAAAYPISYQGELRLYYGGSNGTHGSRRDGFFCLARLRPDGFAGLEPAEPGTKGTVITQPLRCSGRQLRVSADAAGGSMRVGILDDDRFRLERCEPVRADVTDAPVRWRGGQSLVPLKGRDIRLQVELRSAKLYSLGFSD